MLRFLLCLLFIVTSGKILSQAPPLSTYLLEDDSSPTPALKELLEILEIPHQNTLQSIVEQTQLQWIQTGKERWEFGPIQEDKKDHLSPIFKRIGLFDTIDATQMNYEYALVYGGFYKRVQQRIDHLIAQFQKGVRFQQVILLTGQRFLDPNTEEKSMTLKTETEMMVYLWNNTQMPEEIRRLPLYVIDAPRRQNSDLSSSRPNTKDTLVEWLKTSPKLGSCLFISNQPFSGYQDSVARSTLPSAFSIETIGCQADREMPVAVFLDSLARLLYQENIRRGAKSGISD